MPAVVSALAAPVLGAAPLDADVVAWARAAGGATAPFKARLSTYVRALKASGVWPLLGRHHIRGAETVAQALTCLVTRTICTAQNFNLSTQFRPFHGFLGDSTANYIDWNGAPAACGITVNSAHLSQFIDTLGALNPYLGSVDGTGADYAVLPQIGQDTLSALNTTTTAASGTVATAAGLWIVDRISSTQVVGAANGADITTSTNNAATRSITSITELAQNNSGTPRFFTDARVFASSSGASLGTSGRAAYAVAINAFAKSIGQGGW